MRPAELSQWYRAYVAVPIDIAVKLLVLGAVLSFAVQTTTHESNDGVEHDNGTLEKSGIQHAKFRCGGEPASTRIGSLLTARLEHAMDGVTRRCRSALFDETQ